MRSLVPLHLQCFAALQSYGGRISNDCDTTRGWSHLAHAFNSHSCLLIEGDGLGPIRGRTRDDGGQHIRDIDIEAINGFTGHFTGYVQAGHGLAYVFELALLLERRVLRDRKLSGFLAELSVSEFAATLLVAHYSFHCLTF